MVTLTLPSFPMNRTTEMVGSIRLCPEIAFADHKGKRKSGIEKKSRKLLTSLREPLEKFLANDETILNILRAQSHVNGFQQYTMGIFVYALTATVVVVTDKRFLQLRVTPSNKWEQGIVACRWECVSAAIVKGFFGKEINLHFPDGKKHRVWKLPGTQGKVLGKLLPELVQANNQGAARPGAVAHLCPECKTELTHRQYQCSGCRLLFKNERKMRWLALLPGAAYFYCGKLLLGVLDLFGEGVLLLALLVTMADIVLGATAGTEDVLVGIGVFVFLLGLEIAVTIHHCAHFIRDFIPTSQHAETAEQAFAASAGFKT